jgi:hypothetical protein
MASLGQTYHNADAPADEFELIPAGTVALAQVIASDVLPTKNNDGTILKLQWEIMTGNYERRQIFVNLNIANPNAQAQSIAQRELANMADAMGLPGVSDSEELHFKPVSIRVGVREDKSGNYRPQNTITKYSPANAAGQPQQHRQPMQQARPAQQPAQTQQRPAASQSPPANRAAGNRPWNNRATA